MKLCHCGEPIIKDDPDMDLCTQLYWSMNPGLYQDYCQHCASVRCDAPTYEYPNPCGRY